MGIDLNAVTTGVLVAIIPAIVFWIWVKTTTAGRALWMELAPGSNQGIQYIRRIAIVAALAFIIAVAAFCGALFVPRSNQTIIAGRCLDLNFESLTDGAKLSAKRVGDRTRIDFSEYKFVNNPVVIVGEDAQGRVLVKAWIKELTNKHVDILTQQVVSGNIGGGPPNGSTILFHDNFYR
jgi:hypothetical protein